VPPITLTSSRPIPSSKVRSRDFLDRYGLAAHESPSRPGLYLSIMDYVLKVESDENGNCTFEVPTSSDIPWPIITALEDFDVLFRRMVDLRNHAITPFGLQDSIADVLGEENLSPADNVVRRVLGKSHYFEPGSEWAKKAEIAEQFVAANPDLAREDNIAVLMIIVDDVYERSRSCACQSSEAATVAVDRVNQE
jgi:hypothetical protein